jgi:hypothetical protein
MYTQRELLEDASQDFWLYSKIKGFKKSYQLRQLYITFCKTWLLTKGRRASKELTFKEEFQGGINPEEALEYIQHEELLKSTIECINKELPTKQRDTVLDWAFNGSREWKNDNAKWANYKRGMSTLRRVFKGVP